MLVELVHDGHALRNLSPLSRAHTLQGIPSREFPTVGPHFSIGQIVLQDLEWRMGRTWCNVQVLHAFRNPERLTGIDLKLVLLEFPETRTLKVSGEIVGR